MEVVITNHVASFVQSLSVELSARVDRSLQLLETFGHELRFPYSRKVSRGLFELRILGPVHIRLLYFFHENQAVVIHGIIKKGNRVPKNSIDYALEARKKYIA